MLTQFSSFLLVFISPDYCHAPVFTNQPYVIQVCLFALLPKVLPPSTQPKGCDWCFVLFFAPDVSPYTAAHTPFFLDSWPPVLCFLLLFLPLTSLQKARFIDPPPPSCRAKVRVPRFRNFPSFGILLVSLHRCQLPLLFSSESFFDNPDFLRNLPVETTVPSNIPFL